MNNSFFDISLVELEDWFTDEQYDTETLYFIAPKEWLYKKYDEAVWATISIEYPIGDESTEYDYAHVEISPTRCIDDAYEDYDWTDFDLEATSIKALIDLAKKYRGNLNGWQ